jgi:hypothetical protein
LGTRRIGENAGVRNESTPIWTGVCGSLIGDGGSSCGLLVDDRKDLSAKWIIV